MKKKTIFLVVVLFVLLVVGMFVYAELKVKERAADPVFTGYIGS